MDSVISNNTAIRHSQPVHQSNSSHSQPEEIMSTLQQPKTAVRTVTETGITNAISGRIIIDYLFM